MFHSIYKEIGVTPIINAGGTKSAYGGSKMSDEVLEAIREASRSFVSMIELNKKIGEYIARITGAEAGMVTSGAASGTVLSIAACMTGTDISKIRRLPDSTGMKNELIIQKIHRGAYSHMYTFSGAKFVEIGNFNECLEEELEGAITEKTVAMGYLFGPRVPRSGLTFSKVIEIAHKYKIPVIVSAAAMLPPKKNLSKYIQEGADLVVFSGGKMIHGPQATGLLFGKRSLVEAALANASPNHAIGRPHKVSKEDMVGLYAALKSYIEIDEEKMFKNFIHLLQPIIKALSDIKGIKAEIIHDEINHHVPVIVIQFDPEWLGPSGAEISTILLQKNPRIFIQYFKELGHLVVNPVSLQDGENEIVAMRLREELTLYNKSTIKGIARSGS